MRVIQKPQNAGERVVALGTFDGVHRGHRALLLTAKQLADELNVPLRVCTFNRHPLEILRPDNPPVMLSTIPEKASQLFSAGVDETELIPFDRSVADLEPEQFLERMHSMITVRGIVAGWNYSFGKNGRGNADLLREDGKKHGYKVIIVPPTTLEDGTVISSSLVRRSLQDGDMQKVSELLGYTYSLTGTVAQGKHQGHKLGFPTANIEPWKRKALPKFGVYTGMLETDTEMLPAVVNIGIQPTIPSGKVTVEAHILTESPELYGQKVRLSLLKMLRSEKRFDSVEELTRQIEQDREEALRLFHMA
ncbi:bifunctional riboflavin kinase/FAD synthetase [Aristaeella lactis]|uniref:Riboflavin kinase / FMN adenylyltransferase n=1 Tax=Aristaeella lactis TaxID=3046383 RepID=A0AC61PI20_9FIRM|nr:bifunctional riboflavin kinase/FAD synthetase [Aristaeella lactis]QUA53626.1 bifunctional riboflavin kinase/FAD synthetase [Aristaeella lactis]SMC37809.1 riboflavin kinase / FMN adenylyltransferase [Aristaeella lactis]